jgi:hypothetical protein
MRRAWAIVVAVGVVSTGCDNQRITALEGRVTTLEQEHTATRDKLQALLVWINPKPDKTGLYDWLEKVHAKVFPGTSDPVKPAPPPPPF